MQGALARGFAMTSQSDWTPWRVLTRFTRARQQPVYSEPTRRSPAYRGATRQNRKSLPSHDGNRVVMQSLCS
jgi:hypothetical protein